MIFRFENNMPEYWMNESRDFQLLTRLDDSIFMGQRADIATIQNLNDNKKCKNTFLDLLAKKVGFFTEEYIEDNVLRNIIGAFRIAVKHKGSKQGIIYAVTAILKAENSTGEPEVRINANGDYAIDIYTPINLQNKLALREFLKYIIPTGFIVNIYSYMNDVPVTIDKFNNVDTVIWSRNFIKNIGKIKTEADNNASRFPAGNFKEDFLQYMQETYHGSENLGMVVDIADLTPEPKAEEKAGQIISNKNLETGINVKEDSR